MGQGHKLSKEYYCNEDVVALAADLLGKELFTCIEGSLCSGIIVETEAYKGPEDLGSHAYGGRRTARNETMYAEGGVIYMYVCYGIHDMLNVVTGPEASSHAILIRAARPVQGLEQMRERRMLFNDDKRLCKGPGSLAKAFGLNKAHDKLPLSGDLVWIEERTELVKPGDIVRAPRVGLNIIEPYRSVPWRFYLRDCPFVSARNRRAEQG